EVRDLLKKCDKGFRADWLRDMHYCKSRATALIRDLISDGYIEPRSEPKPFDQSGIQWYSLTERGRSLVRATAAVPVSREHAERTLREFMERVKVVNCDSRFLVRVTDVVVFGSYLSDTPSLGDLDLACDYDSKIEDAKLRVKLYSKHFQKSGRQMRTFISDFTWPQEEVELFLKSRMRTISLQPMHSFLGMPKRENFQYRVLLGDPDGIARRLKQRVDG
ncbi:MAG: hypothetical protein P4L81_06030, partial [Candidatus Pacebacteria bacterium]|nr:hypothetical protein [Candidatus Paceibacterota bacterium]